LTNQSAQRVPALHNAWHDNQIHVFITKQRGQNALGLSGENNITVIWDINTEYKYNMKAT